MARIKHVNKAQQRYRMVAVIDPETGEQKRTPVMARNGQQKVTKRGRPVFRDVTVEDRTQPLEPYTCGFCHKPIEIGTPYKWVQPQHRGKMTRHADCPTWRPSELTSSDKLSTIYGAQESFEDGKPYETPEDYGQALEDAAEQIREAAEGYRESASAIEDGFGHETSMSEDLNQKADDVEGWADEIEDAANTIRDLEIKCAECDELEEDGPHHDFKPDLEGDEPEMCGEEDCGLDEDAHHDFDGTGWYDEADSEADAIYNMPI